MSQPVKEAFIKNCKEILHDEELCDKLANILLKYGYVKAIRAVLAAVRINKYGKTVVIGDKNEFITRVEKIAKKIRF